MRLHRHDHGAARRPADAAGAHPVVPPRPVGARSPDTGQTARINSAHGHGEQVLIDTIQENFGIPINHYVEIDFVGFERLVDAVGGIPMWFDAPVRDEHTGLSVPDAGCQVLDGDAGAQVRPVPVPRVQGRGRRVAQPTPPPTSVASPASRSSSAARSSKAVGKGLGEPGHPQPARVRRRRERPARPTTSTRATCSASAGSSAPSTPRSLVGYSLPSERFRTPRGRRGAAGRCSGRPSRSSTSSAACRPGTVSPPAIDVDGAERHGVQGQAADAAGALEAIGFTIERGGDLPGRARRPHHRVLRRRWRGGRPTRRRGTSPAAPALVADPTSTRGRSWS